MDAFLVPAPRGWHTQDALLYPGSCGRPNPFPVFRLTSPDGLSSLEKLPRMDWVWGKYVQKSPQKGCLPLREEISPADFLRTLSTMMGVEYVGELPVPEPLQAYQKKFNTEADAWSEQNSRTHPQMYEANHVEIALAGTRYKNGTFSMEGTLRVDLYCHRFSMGGPRSNYWSENCSADVLVLRVPQGKAEEARKSLEKSGEILIPRWFQAYKAMMAARDAQAE